MKTPAPPKGKASARDWRHFTPQVVVECDQLLHVIRRKVVPDAIGTPERPVPGFQEVGGNP